MIKSIDEIQQSVVLFETGSYVKNSDYKRAREIFLDNLKLEEKNITEKGEKASVELLRTSFEKYIGLFEIIKSYNIQDYQE